MFVKRHNVHVCMVSQQATPNFIAALDGRFRPKEVILLVSADMAERARWLEAAFSSLAIATSVRRINDPWNIAATQEEILNVLIECDGKDVALNVTGGTKPMAIAAQEVFRSQNRPIFYVHPENNQIVPLFPHGEPFVIEERMRLPDHLAIHGFRELQRDLRDFPERYHMLCEEWIKEVERFAQPLRTINFLAQQAKGSLRVELRSPEKMQHALELIEKLDSYGIANLHAKELVFPDESARFFTNGGWLELHAARVIKDLAGGRHIQDMARSLKVESDGRVINEIDVAVLAANRLYLVECKTKYLAAQDAASGTEMLYKLDSLTALGGLNTRGAIISFQQLNAYDRQRAKDLRIKVIEGGQLRNLDRHLADWISSPL
jgi:hypothetical protein